MKKYAVIFFFFTSQIVAQPTALDSLAAQLKRSTTVATASAIYDWLTANVAYDNRFRYRRSEGDTMLRQEPYNVVRTRRAVCIGYAKLFKELCQLNGIESVVVEGWARNGKGFVGREEHAWTVLKTNDLWAFADATWGSDGGFLATKYFQTDPSVFSENHLPHDPMWQLSTAPKSFNCFVKNENCHQPFAENFNFTDTIAAFLRLDSLEKSYNQSLRILRFNPNDLWAMRSLAEYYGSRATVALTDYARIRQVSTTKKRRADNHDAALKCLDAAEQNFKAAQAIYEKLTAFARPQQYTDAHLNLELTNEMLENLAAERAFFQH